MSQPGSPPKRKSSSTGVARNTQSESSSRSSSTHRASRDVCEAGSPTAQAISSLDTLFAPTAATSTIRRGCSRSGSRSRSSPQSPLTKANVDGVSATGQHVSDPAARRGRRAVSPNARGRSCNDSSESYTSRHGTAPILIPGNGARGSRRGSDDSNNSSTHSSGYTYYDRSAYTSRYLLVFEDEPNTKAKSSSPPRLPNSSSRERSDSRNIDAGWHLIDPEDI